MTPYELLEHTADAKFRATGATIEEAFREAARAMTAIVTNPDALEKGREAVVEVHAFDHKRLLFEWLDQLLFLHDTEGILAADVEDLVITRHLERYTLRATVLGDDATKHGGNLKAVTYHDMKVEQESDGTWVCQAVIDI